MDSPEIKPIRAELIMDTIHEDVSNIENNSEVKGLRSSATEGSTHRVADDDSTAQQIGSLKGSSETLIFPGYAPVIFYYFNQKSLPRYWLLKCITHPWFEKFSMFIIIVNCVTMGMYQPCEEKNCTTTKCTILGYIDDFIYFFFAIEMCIKIMAMGLFGERTYLGEMWNRLDCFIVLAGAVDYLSISENSGITAIRTVKILRPLRAINRIPSVRILVTIIIDTLPMLGNVMLLGILIFTVFGIIGVQLWQGLLRNRCFSSTIEEYQSILLNTTLNTTNIMLSDLASDYYSPGDSDFVCSRSNGMTTCQDIPNSSVNARFNVCRASDRNPFQGSISFDNIGYAFIVIFQVITLESWVTIMYYVQDAHSFWSWIFFVALIMIGSFFLLNIILVIISVQFGKTKKRELELMAKERRMLNRSSESIDKNAQVGCWEEILRMIGSMIMRIVRFFFKRPRKLSKRERRQSMVQGENPRNTTVLKILCCCCFERLSNSRVYIIFFNLRDKAREITSSKLFTDLILGTILINSIFMGAEHHQQPETLTTIAEISNYIFTAIFTMEMLLKLFAHGFYGYIKDPLNIFDSLIVAIGIFEIFSSSDNSGISVLRTFRLIRILKVFRMVKTLRRQILVMVKTLDSVATFGCILLLFIFIFSTLGMHLFGCKFYDIDENGEKSVDRKNYDSLFWATITVFQILTEEDWNEVLYIGMEKTGPWASIYFIVLMIFGNYVLFSLLIAIIVEGFSDIKEEVSIAMNDNVIIKPIQTEIEMKNIQAQRNRLTNTTAVSDEKSKVLLRRPDLNPVEDAKLPNEEFPYISYSLYMFSKTSKIRRFCVYLTEQKWFNKAIFFVIFLNCITLAMERPSISFESYEYLVLSTANYMITFIFFVEMLIKITAFGFCIGEKTYLRSIWNVIDFFLVFISAVDIIISIVAKNHVKILSLLKILRIMRTLRPLRLINNAPGLKLVVTSLLSSLRLIGNTVLICFAFFIIFAILGVQLFSGKLYYCKGEEADIRNVVNKTDCLSNPNNEWVNTVYNYDNIIHSLFTLFIIATKDGWVDAMYNGIDAVGVDMQPIQNNNEYMALFFIVYLLVVGFFVVNMFIGVIIDNFHRCREAQADEENRINQEKKARKAAKILHRNSEIPYCLKYSNIRRKLHDLVINPYFDLIITAFVGCNVLSMAIEYYNMPEYLDNLQELLNLIFTGIFLVEAILRLLALGIKRYFKDRWNRLDMFIVIISIVSIFLNRFVDLKTMPIDPTLIRVIRVIRIARVLKLLKTARGIRSLLATVGESLPQVGNLALLFGLIFFIFSTLGVELFGRLSCDSRLNECSGINKYTNFNNFGAAFLTLFRILTGDNWNSIMKDAMLNNAVCINKNTQMNSTHLYLIEINSITHSHGWCLNSLITPVYFIFFVLIGQFVLMNVVIAVLMKQLEDANNKDNEESEIERQTQSANENSNQKNGRCLPLKKSNESNYSLDYNETGEKLTYRV